MDQQKSPEVVNKYLIIVISLISAIVFGLIDGTFFIFAEEYVQTELIKISFFDENMAELATGGISASIAIFIAAIIHEKIKEHYELIDSPLIEAIGVMLGTIILLVIYYFYKKYKTEVKNEVVNLFNSHKLYK